MIPSGSKRRERAAQRGHPERTLLGLEVRDVVGADAVLVADGPAVGDDDLARRGLEPAPALERLVRVGREPEDVRGVQARPAPVDVRQVAERVDALAERLEAVPERRPERGGERLEPAPVDGGLERVHRVPGVPERVAQVRAAEALPHPSAAATTRRRGRPGAPRDRADVARRGARRPGPSRTRRRSRGSARRRGRGGPGSGAGTARRARRRPARRSSRSRAGSRRGPCRAARRNGPASRARVDRPRPAAEHERRASRRPSRSAVPGRRRR